MTLERAVSLFDASLANTAPLALKTRWLSEADALFFAELLAPRREGDFAGYDESTPADTELLIPAPYDVAYGYYLAMKLYDSLGETVRANNAAERFNNAWFALANAVSREMPVQATCTIKAGDCYV